MSVYKNTYIKKSRIENFYQANIKSGHKILDKLEKHVFLLEVSVHNVSASMGINQTRENIPGRGR